MKKNYIIKKLKKIKSTLVDKYNIMELGLFGSFSRGDNSENSDIDILVEYSSAISLFQVVEMKEYLEGIFNKKVDVVNKKNIKEMIKKRILDEVIFV